MGGSLCDPIGVPVGETRMGVGQLRISQQDVVAHMLGNRCSGMRNVNRRSSRADHRESRCRDRGSTRAPRHGSRVPSLVAVEEPVPGVQVLVVAQDESFVGR